MTRTDATWVPATIAPERIRELLDHARPEDFAAFDDLREDLDSGRWILGPCIEHRDSDPLEQSNAAAIVAILREHKARAWTVRRCNHWAVGWVDHLSYAVVDRKGRPTLAARIMEGIAARLADYPVLDEDDLSEREAEDLAETLEAVGPRLSPLAPPGALHEAAGALGYCRGDDIRERDLTRYLTARGYIACDTCDGSGFAPADDVDAVTYADDVVRVDDGPPFLPCVDCGAHEHFPLPPRHGTIVGPLPLFDGTCGPYVPLPT